MAYSRVSQVNLVTERKPVNSDDTYQGKTTYLFSCVLLSPVVLLEQ
jgi:hypothetical protein